MSWAANPPIFAPPSSLLFKLKPEKLNADAAGKIYLGRICPLKLISSKCWATVLLYGCLTWIAKPGPLWHIPPRPTRPPWHLQTYLLYSVWGTQWKCRVHNTSDTVTCWEVQMSIVPREVQDESQILLPLPSLCHHGLNGQKGTSVFRGNWNCHMGWCFLR